MPIFFTRKLAMVGGSLRLTIPKEIVDSLQLRSGEQVRIWATDHQVVLERPEKSKSKPRKPQPKKEP